MSFQNNFSELIDDVISSLSSSSAMNDIKFIPQYENSERQFPLKGKFVSVGIGGINVMSGAFGGYVGEIPGMNKGLFGNCADIRLLFEIFLPLSCNGSDSFKTFSDILEHLSDELFLSIRSVSCSPVSYDSDCNAFLLKAEATFAAVIGKNSSDELFSEVTIKRRS